MGAAVEKYYKTKNEIVKEPKHGCALAFLLALGGAQKW